MRYSVIIPTYNRSKSLLKTLDSTISQTISPDQYEIIIVDDGSTDDTEVQIANYKLQITKPQIKYFKIEHGGSAKARNFGIKESKGEIIFFTDDDCIVPKNWMETLLDGYRRYPNVVGVGGWNKSATDILSKKYFSRYKDFAVLRRNRDMFEAESKTNIFPLNLAGNTSNMSYKKKILEEVGGFDDNLNFAGLVDWELKKNIQDRGHHLLYLPIIVGHLKDFNTINFIKKSFNAGRGYYYMTLKYPDLSPYSKIKASNVLRPLLTNIFNNPRFYWARLLESQCHLLGQIYAKYFRPFKNVRQISIQSPNNMSIVKKNNKEMNAIVTEINVINSRSNNNKKGIEFGDFNNKDFYSIVISTYNRFQSLKIALASVTNQTLFPNQYEIIVVDDGSTDDTEAQITNYKLQITKPEIKYFKIKHGGPAKARNFGIKQAKGEIIFFTDDDCIVPHNWMETLLDGYRRYPDVVGVGGWYKSTSDILNKNFIEKYLHCNFYASANYLPAAILLNNEVISNDPRLGFGGVFANNTANISFKRDILKNIGCFREDYYWPGSEDSDLAFKILVSGAKLLYLPFHVLHTQDLDLWDFIKLFFRRGANFYLFLKFNKKALEGIYYDSAGNQYRLQSLVYRLFYRKQRFINFLQFISYKAGIIYMKNKLGG